MASPKIAFLASSGKQAITAKNALEKIYASTSVDDADVIIVLGGDGMMLDTLRQYINRPVKVFGMNRGTIGFLMNEFSKDDLLKICAKTVQEGKIMEAWQIFFLTEII